MYVITRTDGKYVAPSGLLQSYTTSLERARKYHTRKEAEADLCPENERVWDVTELLTRGFSRGRVLE